MGLAVALVEVTTQPCSTDEPLSRARQGLEEPTSFLRCWPEQPGLLFLRQNSVGYHKLTCKCDHQMQTFRCDILWAWNPTFLQVQGQKREPLSYPTVCTFGG